VATVESTIKFPYKRSLGPVLGAFMTALTEQRLIGIRNGRKVMCPPLEWDPETGAELAHDFVDVGPAGTVQSWAWVAKPTEQHPLDKPFAMALIKLDGADTALLHAVDAGSIDQMSTGMRVAPRWRAERKGHITDLEAFVPGEDAQGGGGSGAEEPVTMMDYNASITYNTPVPTNITRGDQANEQGRFLGFKCPECGRMYTSTKSFCPIDNIELTEQHEIDLPQTGVVSNYTIIEPVQYPGQTETERFSRVHVKLDGVDVVLGFQVLIDVPVDEVHIGMKVSAVWASEGERTDLDPRAEGRLIGWIPTGEPDIDDPTLVNRMP
jgi:uncharacterized protein